MLSQLLYRATSISCLGHPPVEVSREEVEYLRSLGQRSHRLLESAGVRSTVAWMSGNYLMKYTVQP